MIQDYRQLVLGLREEWLATKENQAQRLRRLGDYPTADRIERCAMFEGTESFDRLCALFKEPQAVEFCLMTGFPSLHDLEKFRDYGPEYYGIYVNAGDIELHNPGNVILAGATNAEITCDSMMLHSVTVLHGAVATVRAKGWSVVRPLRDRVSHIVATRTENAVVL